MDFGLSEEQELLQETLRGFVKNECPPNRLRELFDAAQGCDPALWAGLAELGLAGLVIPEEYGGAGMELLDLALVQEVLGEGATPVPLLTHSLASLALVLGGSAEQQERWLPKLASGEATATFALGETGDVWSPADCTAKVNGGRLSGVKRFVPHTAADLIVVATSGGGLALVESGAGGLEIEPLEGIDRTRPIGQLTFAETPCEMLPGDGTAHRVWDAGLALLAADSFGAAWRLVNLSVEYAGTREQFSQPIAQFQSVKHQLASLATEIEPTRSLYWFAAHAFDHIPEQREREIALAKAHITDCAMQIAREAVELHGGLGFTWECDVQIWFKRAMFNRAFLGTPELHRERSCALAGW